MCSSPSSKAQDIRTADVLDSIGAQSSGMGLWPRVPFTALLKRATTYGLCLDHIRLRLFEFYGAETTEVTWKYMT